MTDDHEKRINILEREQAVQNTIIHEMSNNLIKHTENEEAFQSKVLLALDSLNANISNKFLNVVERLAVLETRDSGNKKIFVVVLGVVVAGIAALLGLRLK